MFGYAVAFILGAASAAGVAYWNRRCVDRAVSSVRSRYDEEVYHLRNANARLRADMNSIQRSSDCADAYKRGVKNGRRDPITQAERLVESFGGRTVDIRTARGTGKGAMNG